MSASKPDASTPAPLLVVEDLTLLVEADNRTVVDGVCFAVDEGGTTAIVGESASGKSLSLLAVLGLLPTGVVRVRGSARLRGRDLFAMAPAERRAIAGRQIGAVFQDPVGSLTPHMAAGSQIAEATRVHGATRAQAHTRMRALLDELGLEPRVARAFAHQLSGGMCQRVALAMALANEPALVVADEPTTALDTISQAQMLALLHRTVSARGAGLLIVSHDLGVVAGLADHVVVMHRGRVVEQGPVAQIFSGPTHPVTQLLLAARSRLPVVATPPSTTSSSVAGAGDAISVTHLTVEHPRRAPADAPTGVFDVSFAVRRGTTCALVGGSGAGKSTVARAICGLAAARAGTITINGSPMPLRPARVPRALRRQIQPVFQDPAGSLDPTASVRDILAEPLKVWHADLSRSVRDERIASLLASVHLPADMLTRRPHQISGGQQQRLCLARALAVGASVLVLDEPLSALDVSLQGEIVALLAQLKAEHGLTYLVVTHDLGLVARFADDIVVLDHGRVVETGSVARVFSAPTSEAMRALLEATPPPDPARARARLASGGALKPSSPA